MWLEILRLAVVLAIAVLVLGIGLRVARDRERHLGLRMGGGLVAGVVGAGLFAVGLVAAWGALLIALAPSGDAPPDGPFPLGGEHLVGGASFDDVDRCPFEFQEIARVERCLGEDRSFQEQRWWVAATGPARTPGLPGDVRTCRRFGIEGDQRCSFSEISTEPERTRSRLVAVRSGPNGANEVLVVEIAGLSPRQATREALDRLSAPAEP
ncbi:MAG: hypothetical protein ACQGVK_06810 [Myxococcota bacterium]